MSPGARITRTLGEHYQKKNRQTEKKNSEEDIMV